MSAVAGQEDTAAQGLVHPSVWMWHLGKWFSGEHRQLRVGFDDPRGFFQPESFYDSTIVAPPKARCR